MTLDFINQLQEACDVEGCAYVIIVALPGTECAHLSHNFDNWKHNPKFTVREELHQLVDVIGDVHENPDPS